MKHAVLGSGAVGQALANRLLELGHQVTMGSRTAEGAAAVAWAAGAGDRARAADFASAAAAAEVAWLAVSGQHAVTVVEAAGAGLDGKVLLDLTNPLDFSRGFPPRLFVCNDDSLGEQVQRANPRARVVKTLNTLANSLMVQPGKLSRATDVFVAGEDAEAKATVAEILTAFGHRAPIDLGGIEASRGLEAWLLMWTRLYGVLGTAEFNLDLVRAAP
ncbi:MAG: NAD(P)-binding domain-containing protein [Myxococcota bacterium]